MSQQSRSERLAGAALCLVVAVLALFAPSAATAYGSFDDGPLTHHTVVAHAGKQTGPEDAPALRVVLAHRLDAHIPGPQPVGPARTAVDTAPHRAAGGPDARPATTRVQPREAVGSAAPRAPPHR
ncbi:hypothetical protein [Streptomyces sp. NPDC003006]